MSKKDRFQQRIIWKVFLLDFIFSILILALIQNFRFKGLLFQNQGILYFLLLLLPAYILFFQDHKIIQNKHGDRNHSKRHLYKFLALKFCFVGLLLGLSDPVIGTESAAVASREGDVMVCLDLSRSMDVKDIEGVSRLEASRNLLKATVNKLSGQRIGLCIFAENAMIELPLTRDYDRFKLMVSDVNTSHFSNQGTDVGGALQKAKNTLENKKLSAILKKVNVNKSSKTLEKKNVIEMSVDEYNFYLESYLNKSDYPDINNKIVKPNNNIFYKFNLFLKNR